MASMETASTGPANAGTDATSTTVPVTAGTADPGIAHAGTAAASTRPGVAPPSVTPHVATGVTLNEGGTVMAGAAPNPRQNFGADAPPAPSSPQHTEVPPAGIDAAFLADRTMFWSRFTTFTTGAVIAVVVLLIGMAIFLR